MMTGISLRRPDIRKLGSRWLLIPLIFVLLELILGQFVSHKATFETVATIFSLANAIYFLFKAFKSSEDLSGPKEIGIAVTNSIVCLLSLIVFALFCFPEGPPEGYFPSLE